MNTPASPTQWLYGLYEIVLVTLLFVTPSPAICFRFRQLDACIGASDPIDFVVRAAALVSRSPASITSHRTVVTIANAPLIAGDGRNYASRFDRDCQRFISDFRKLLALT